MQGMTVGTRRLSKEVGGDRKGKYTIEGIIFRWERKGIL